MLSLFCQFAHLRQDCFGEFRRPETKLRMPCAGAQGGFTILFNSKLRADEIYTTISGC